MSNLKYSFIIPAFNAGKVIGRCIYSICNIKHKNLEIIVINDGSRDDTEKVVTRLREQDKRIKLISVQNGGVSRARNLGIEKSTGDYVIFCDADDYYYTEMFGKVDEIIENQRPDILHFGYCCDYRIKKYHHTYSFKCNQIYKDNILLEKSFWMKVIDGDDCLNVWHMLISVDIAKKIQFDSDLKYGEDTLYVLKSMLEANTILFSDIELYDYVVSIGGAIGNISQEMLTVKIENIIEMYQRQMQLFSANDIRISEDFLNNRCFQMIEGDLNKLYLSAKNKSKANENINTLAEKISNRHIRQQIRKWNKWQSERWFFFQKVRFVGRNIGKTILLPH